MWFLVALFVVSLVATLLLTPRPKFENARASTLDDLRFPRSTEGAPVPLILGRGMMRGPNTAWAGDWEAVPITKKQKTGLFSSKRVIIGHTYYVGLQLALGLGPCTLHRIKSDKDELWAGTANTDGAAVNINLPNLYGGKEKGGGFICNARYYTGSATQNPDAYLEAQIGVGDVPGYRHFAYIVFPHANIGEQNNLRSMWFELSRYTNGLGALGGINIIGQDLNPMEVLFQAFNLEFGGLGVPDTLLDIPSMLAAAQTLFDEGNGMSIIVSSPNSGKDIANEVLRQVDGLMYQDPQTGKMVLKLIRPDYTVGDLPVFDESNVLTVRQFTSKLWEDTINQVRVTYTNKDKGYEKGTAMVQDLANISAQERIRAITQAYPGVTNGQLAVDLATRDLAQGSVPLMSVLLEMDRNGASLRPGDPFVWAWDAYGIEQVVMRVKNFDLGALNDNRIAVEATQDEFAVGLTIFAPPDSSGSGPLIPDSPASELTTRVVFEAPYFFAAASDIGLTAEQALVGVSAVPSAGAESFDAHISTNTVDYELSGEGIVFAPSGTITAAISATAGITTGSIGSLTVTTGDEIEAVTAADNAGGAGLFMIGSELFAHQGVTDNGDGTLTLANVRRALLDTIPAAHALGARAWFMSADNVIDAPQTFDAAIRVKLTPTTFTDALSVAAAPFDALTLTKRAARPLMPENIKFDGGTAFTTPASPIGSKTITWSNRSRTAAVVRGITDSATANETGQETILRYRLNAGGWTEVVLAAGVVSHSFDAGATLGGDVVDYELYSRRDGLLSRAKWTGASGGNVMSGAII